MKGILVLPGVSKPASHSYFDFLEELDIPLARVDFAIHKMPEKSGECSYSDLIKDMDRGIEELKGQGVTRIVAFAKSLGSIVCLLNTEARKHIERYMFWGSAIRLSENDILEVIGKPFREFELGDNGFTKGFLRSFKKDIKIYQGEHDEVFTPEKTKEFSGLLGAELVVLKGEPHGPKSQTSFQKALADLKN